MKIEFFHDVICSFCFPMSDRMRNIANKHSDWKIIHRSYALSWDEEDYIRSFGSREAVKSEVVNHWKHANKIDYKHRFNIEGMLKTSFLFPMSRIPLRAAKAAGIIAGEAIYWEVFDSIQRKLFVENKNIEDMGVIEEAVMETDISFADWKVAFENPSTEKAVIDDIKLGQKYGIQSVPTLIIEGKYAVSGVKSQEELERLLEEISKQLNC